MSAQALPTRPVFEEHITGAFHAGRHALERLLVAGGADPSDPQDAARLLGINRNLTWKLSKVLNGENLYEALQHLPGPEGLEIFVRASLARGADDAMARRVRQAREELDRLVELHTGDRATLDLILDNMGTPRAERLEQSRKLAFRGNSGIWGAQAKVRLTTCIISPSAQQPHMVDTVMVAGMLEFRRLRPNVRWPLFRTLVYTAEGKPRVSPERAVDPAYADTTGPRFIGAFCKPSPPPVVRFVDRQAAVYELEEAPIGNAGAVTFIMGTLVQPTGDRYASATEPTADLSAQLTMPAELLLFDVFLHKDLADWGEPESFMIGQLIGNDPSVAQYRIPMGQEAKSLPGHPPLLRCPQVPRYEELMSYSFEQLGWAQRDFRVLRLLVKYPPMHSSVVMRFKLPPPPAPKDGSA